jgi:hypothetical protein
MKNLSIFFELLIIVCTTLIALYIILVMGFAIEALIFLTGGITVVIGWFIFTQIQYRIAMETVKDARMITYELDEYVVKAELMEKEAREKELVIANSVVHGMATALDIKNAAEFVASCAEDRVKYSNAARGAREWFFRVKVSAKKMETQCYPPKSFRATMNELKTNSKFEE